MRSIRGALARPSSRSTTRLPLTSASVGTVLTRKRSASSGCWLMSTEVTRRRARSLRARCAIRLSIRRAGPEWVAPKKTSKGRVSSDIEGFFSLHIGHFKPRLEARVYTQRTMWEAYRIGLSLGLGIGIGGLLSALVAPRRAVAVAVAVAAAALGAAVGYAIGGWHESVAGGIGGALGAVVVATLVAGALDRGGTRGGTAALVGLASLVLAALALDPVRRLPRGGRAPGGRRPRPPPQARALRRPAQPRARLSLPTARS